MTLSSTNYHNVAIVSNINKVVMIRKYWKLDKNHLKKIDGILPQNNSYELLLFMYDEPFEYTFYDNTLSSQYTWSTIEVHLKHIFQITGEIPKCFIISQNVLEKCFLSITCSPNILYWVTSLQIIKNTLVSYGTFIFFGHDTI